MINLKSFIDEINSRKIPLYKLLSKVNDKKAEEYLGNIADGSIVIPNYLRLKRSSRDIKQSNKVKM